MNYFTTSLMKNLITNDNNLPLFEEALEKSINEILEHELTLFIDVMTEVIMKIIEMEAIFVHSILNMVYSILKYLEIV